MRFRRLMLLLVYSVSCSHALGGGPERFWAGGDGVFQLDMNWIGGMAPNASDTAVFDLDDLVPKPPADPIIIEFDGAAATSGLRVDSGDVTLLTEGYSLGANGLRVDGALTIVGNVTQSPSQSGSTGNWFVGPTGFLQYSGAIELVQSSLAISGTMIGGSVQSESDENASVSVSGVWTGGSANLLRSFSSRGELHNVNVNTVFSSLSGAITNTSIDVFDSLNLGTCLAIGSDVSVGTGLGLSMGGHLTLDSSHFEIQEMEDSGGSLLTMINGSHFILGGSLDFCASAVHLSGEGTLCDGGLWEVAEITLDDQAMLTDAHLSGALTLTVSGQSRVEPGSIGSGAVVSLTMDGSRIQYGNINLASWEELIVTLTDPAATFDGFFPGLVATNQGTLGGDLVLQVAEGYAPAECDVWLIFESDDPIEESFESIDAPELANGLAFDVQVDDHKVFIVVVNESSPTPESCVPSDCNANFISDATEIAQNPALDCNENGMLDECEIAANPLLDQNMNGELDCCEMNCPADLNNDGLTNGVDLAILLSVWGATTSAFDVNNDGIINGADLAELLARWGDCPPIPDPCAK